MIRILEKLEIHQKEHAGERPFVCPICNRMFQEYGQAVVHGIAIHSTEITPRTTADEKRFPKIIQKIVIER